MSTAFDKLARPIQKWIREQGWRELRDIQARATHVLMDGDADLIVAASTAGGKTEAAFLPLLSQVLDDPSEISGFDILYVAPLKALITDQARRLDEICRETELSVIPWHGDVPASVKTRATKRPRGVLLITPESLEALFIRRGMEIPRLFGATRAVILDELHSVLDSERGIQMRSLLARLEQSLNRPIRRVGLSATLGDMGLAKTYLRPDSPGEVREIVAADGEAELQLQLRGYVTGDKDDEGPSATDAIALHLFGHLRGSDNLVFAGARQAVEIYSDRLRTLCEKEHLPQEFYPHHASLSREHRDFVERRLKEGSAPTTAICTSTLELGIDIGDVTCVGQIGAPFSVASLRQRLGRSGRRPGKPAILRQYVVEAKLASTSNFSDRLRLGLVRATAMIELLLEGWCEPPQHGALHLSTLVHQILSVIAERGGIRAQQLYGMLCQKGPFRQVDTTLFLDVLRALGHPETALIEQADDGLLLLGAMGEKLVEHYSFYAVFQTPEEYRLISGGKELGTLPIDNLIAPGMLLIFSGRRWLVLEVHDRDRIIMVSPAKAGVPPLFGGDPGNIHDRVIERMFDILENQNCLVYMDATARELLEEARSHYAQLRFNPGRIAQLDENAAVLATRTGSIRTTTLALALRAAGFTVQTHDGFLEVFGKEDTPPLIDALAALASGKAADLFTHSPNLLFEKFHPHLTETLLQQDALSARLDADGLAELSRSILG
ncbi:ATP-dependent helicase Lhr and Lhr-like helicase [Sphingobium faniae]|uniref:DEAD/DEAH box helicase n=1 Tax=Rhizorhapis sp. SPR117 TaxID=2912611 RepID=UPI0008771311|nr:DEAD/DEAH box helicase [Rhizorhapis sp. SPR117]SCW92586.1 ATP-dependent helicase Lhr and Lhr-like helicase [Sphingobium faniae]